MLHLTHIGTVDARANGFTVMGDQSDLSLWANRPDNRWPCSELAAIAPDTHVKAVFNSSGDLIDGEIPEDVTSNELSAWTIDLLRAAGLNNLADEQETRIR
jgi:hypothetical protein